MKEYSSSQKYLYIDYECDIDDLNLLQVFLQSTFMLIKNGLRLITL